MNMIKKAYIRLYQAVLKVGMKFIKIPKPMILNCLNDTVSLLKNEKVLILIPSYVSNHNLFKTYLEELDKNEISYDVSFCDVQNPTINQVLDYSSKYKPTVIVTIGGGSVIDLGKLIAVKMTNKKDLQKMRGILKVRKKPITQIAVPTTCGSGSEATVAAVVTSDETHEKYPINDPKLVPKYVVLESSFTTTLPKNLTSTTGMDALTHAIECFLGRANTKETINDSVLAIKLILDSLEATYIDGTNLEKRKNMQKAAYLAGCAFTRGYVGYVHALAHQMGGLYNTPHGLANAILLPYVLEEYGDAIKKKNEYLGKVLNDSHFDLISLVYQLNEKMDIPKYIANLKEEDFELIIKRAKTEAHPLYPVPKLLNNRNFLNILRKATKR